MVTDGTTTQADVTLGTEDAGTPPKLYTEEELRKQVLDARSAVMADAMRAKKTAEDALARLETLAKEQEEAELETHRDDPDRLAVIREKQARRKAEAELAKVKPELDRLAQLEAERVTQTKEQQARAVAARFNVDPERLIKLVRYTDGKAEVMEDMAKELPKLTPEKPGLRPDSGRTLGGSLTEQAIRENYRNNPDNPQVRADYLAWRRAKGI